MLDFSKSAFTKEDYDKVAKLVDRAEEVSSSVGAKIDRQSMSMDLEACNMVCPLDLDKLLAFDDFNFSHDVCGIANHLNRETGELEDFFVPRCSKPSTEVHIVQAKPEDNPITAKFLSK